MYRVAHNPTTAPVTVDAVGHRLDGYTYGPVDDAQAEVKHAHGVGLLVWAGDPDEGEASDEYVDALAAAEELEARRRTLLDDYTAAQLRDLVDAVYGIGNGAAGTETVNAGMLARVEEMPALESDGTPVASGGTDTDEK